MKEREPASGTVTRALAKADRAFSIICCLLVPARTHSVRARYCGRTLRTAAGLKQFGARTLGFQNSGSSNPAAHDRSTKQVKPFVPLLAISYARLPSTS